MIIRALLGGTGGLFLSVSLVCAVSGQGALFLSSLSVGISLVTVAWVMDLSRSVHRHRVPPTDKRGRRIGKP